MKRRELWAHGNFCQRPSVTFSLRKLSGYLTFLWTCSKQTFENFDKVDSQTILSCTFLCPTLKFQIKFLVMFIGFRKTSQLLLVNMCTLRNLYTTKFEIFFDHSSSSRRRLDKEFAQLTARTIETEYRLPEWPALHMYVRLFSYKAPEVINIK